jgi:hypothetical protein
MSSKAVTIEVGLTALGNDLPHTLYHFTTAKNLIGILNDEQLFPGQNGRVCFTDDPEQRLFRYMPVVLKFSGELSQDVELTRFEGDAASLAGGDEREFYATHPVSLRPHLQAIFVRSNTFDDTAADFRARFGMSKRDLRAVLASQEKEGVTVKVTDFNDTDRDWYKTTAESADDLERSQIIPH